MSELQPPESWATATIGALCTLRNGYAFKPSDWGRRGLPIIRIQNLNNPDAPFNHFEGKPDERFLVTNGDLLFAWSGTPGTSFGAHVWRGGQAILNQHIFRVDFNLSLFDKAYFKLAINSRLKDLIEKAHGGVGLRHVTKGKFESTPIPVPPLPEQRRIVAKIEELFSELDNAVASLTAARDQLKTYRQALLKHAFEGHLTADWRAKYLEASETAAAGPLHRAAVKLLNLPTGWFWSPLSPLLSLDRKPMTTGPFGTALKKDEHQDSGVPVLGIENIGRAKFVPGNKIFVTRDKANDLLAFAVHPGDAIISRSGTVGEICTVPPSMDGALISTNLIRVALNCEVINPEFFVQMFQDGGPVRPQVKELCKGSSREFLNQTILSSIAFPLCSIEEQREVLREVEAKTSDIAMQESGIDDVLTRASALRQSILQRAFSGQLVPQDPNDEPAAALLARIQTERAQAAPPKKRRAPKRKEITA